MHPDASPYPHPDLVRGYIARRRVKTFHVAGTEDPTNTACGLDLDTLTDAGWARGLRRQGLTLCANCARTVDLDAELENTDTEIPDEEPTE